MACIYKLDRFVSCQNLDYTFNFLKTRRNQMDLNLSPQFVKMQRGFDHIDGAYKSIALSRWFKCINHVPI